MRIALGLEYDGAPFHGWQSQADGSGVQDALERALAAIAGARAHAVAAGRTDAGVHATLQVVHFDTDAMRPDTAWVRGANAFLPESMAVRVTAVVMRTVCGTCGAASSETSFNFSNGRAHAHSINSER